MTPCPVVTDGHCTVVSQINSGGEMNTRDMADTAIQQTHYGPSAAVRRLERLDATARMLVILSRVLLAALAAVVIFSKVVGV